MLIRGAALGLLLVPLAASAAMAAETCLPVPYDNPSASPPALSLSADGGWLAAAGQPGVQLFSDPVKVPVYSFDGAEAVSIHGYLMAVGGGGSVRVYQKQGSTWSSTATVLNAPRPGVRFGASVALGDQWLVVGAPEDGALHEGAAYLYSYSAAGFAQPSVLRPADGRLNDRFGTSVAVDGNTIAVGSPYADDLKVFFNFGAAYVFDAKTGGQTAKLQAADSYRPKDIQFGAAVAIRGDQIVVGAPGDDPERQESAGSAYLFNKEVGGGWSKPIALLPDSPPKAGRQFGKSVALDDKLIAVGAPFAGGGAAFLFTLDGKASGECSGCGGNDFGEAVALWNRHEGHEVFLGGKSGVAGCYRLPEKPKTVSLSLSMTAPEAACPDETATYTITVTNSGSEPVRGFKLETRVEPLKALRSSNRTCQPAAGSKGASCETRNRDAILPSGASLVYTLKGTIPHNAQGSFTVTASVEPPDGFKNLGSPSTVTTTTEILPESACAPPRNTLTVLCGIDGSLRQDTLATYDFLLQGGPGQTGPVRSELTDTFPENLPLFEVSATSGKISALEGVVSWQGEVDPGKAVGIRLRALIWKTEAGTKLCNQAKVSYDSDGDGVLDASVLSDDPNVPGAADACCFTVLPAAAVEGIPTLSDVALAALALFLAALSVRRLRAGPAIPSGGR